MSIRLTISVALLSASLVSMSYAGAETVIVEVKDSKYGTEQPLVVKVGTTVKWLNVEKRQYHSVWFEEEGLEPGEYFFPEESVERTFDKPGTYRYRCEPHEDMFGTIVVEE